VERTPEPRRREVEPKVERTPEPRRREVEPKVERTPERTPESRRREVEPKVERPPEPRRREVEPKVEPTLEPPRRPEPRPRDRPATPPPASAPAPPPPAPDPAPAPLLASSTPTGDAESRDEVAARNGAAVSAVEALRVIEHLRTADNPLTFTQLREALGDPPAARVRARLRQLVEGGDVVRGGSGRRGDPYVYGLGDQ
jgi:hypothetical protein